VTVTRSEQAVGARPRSGHELALRVASTLVLAPLAIVAVWLGGGWFLAFWTIGAIGVLWESTRLMGDRRI